VCRFFRQRPGEGRRPGVPGGSEGAAESTGASGGGVRYGPLTPGTHRQATHLKTAPQEYDVAPDDTGGAERAQIVPSNNSDNLIAFCFCSSLFVLSVLPVLVIDAQNIHIYISFLIIKKLNKL